MERRGLSIKGNDCRERFYVERPICETTREEDGKSHASQANKKKERKIYPRKASQPIVIQMA